MRQMVYFVLDQALLYYVVTRGVTNRQRLLDVMASFTMGLAVMGVIGAFETARSWLVYESLRIPLGIPLQTMGTYLLRETEDGGYPSWTAETSAPHIIEYDMANTAIAFGVAFIALGLIGYFGTGRASVTALIPAALGSLLVILGVAARDPGRRKQAMHGAAIIGLVGLLGAGRGLTKIWPLLAGETVERPNAVIAQAVMALLSLIFILCSA